MKKIFLIVSIALFWILDTQAQTEAKVVTEGATLIVNLTNLKSEKGSVKVGLYNQGSKWLSENIDGKEAIVSNGVAKVVFENLKVGEYAISTFHDKNGNGELDSNALGIPNEPYAFSNDAYGMFGPASYDDAKFDVNLNTEIIIKF